MLNQEFSAYAQIIQLKPDSPELQGQNLVGALHDLIADIRQSLVHQHYLKGRTDEQLVAHFAKGNLAFGAIDQDGKLIACLLMSDLSDTENHDFYAEHYSADNLVAGNWAVHTVGVHPAHTGHKLMAGMLGAMQAHVAEAPEKFATLIAKVADSNEASRANFGAAGFTQIGGGHDSKGYDFTLFGVNASAELAPAFGMPFNTAHDVTRPTAFGS